MLQAGGLTWRDLAYESSAALRSAICVDGHTPVRVSVTNVAGNVWTARNNGPVLATPCKRG